MGWFGLGFDRPTAGQQTRTSLGLTRLGFFPAARRFVIEFCQLEKKVQGMPPQDEKNAYDSPSRRR